MINSMFMLVSQRKPRNQVTIIVYICQKQCCNQPKPQIQLMILEDYYFFLQDKTVTWFWRLREIFDGQKTKGDRLPLENMLEGLISQVWPMM